MEHIGIDLGCRNGQVCIRKGLANHHGEAASNGATHAVPPRPSARSGRRNGTESFHIAGSAQQLGHDVRVVAATLCDTWAWVSEASKKDQRELGR
jgi:hypothetical protein